MKTLTLILILTVAATNGVARAATPEHDMSQHEMAMPHAASQTRHEGAGVIKDVNAKSGKVLLAHDPIPSLHWPAMTMWFELQGALPNGVKIGDPVRFELEQTHSRAWVITHIERKS
jgi:Cu/Ag efflux protein CusF